MENKIFLPPRSWLQSISNVGSEVNMRGYTNAVLLINGNYYSVIFYTKEGLKWEIDNSGIFVEAGVIALSTIDIESITKAVNDILNSSTFFKHLFPYKELNNFDFDTLIDGYVSIPLEIEITSFFNIW
jgi:hypothetical protein